MILPRKTSSTESERMVKVTRKLRRFGIVIESTGSRKRCTHWKLSFRVAPDRSTYRKFQPFCTGKGRKWTAGRIGGTNEFGEENSESRRIRISWIRMSSAALKGTAVPEEGYEVPNRLISMLREGRESKSLRRRYGVKFWGTTRRAYNSVQDVMLKW